MICSSFPSLGAGSKPRALEASPWFCLGLLGGSLPQDVSGCPSVHIPARGTSQVLVVHLGCLLGNHVHVYLLVSVFCFLCYAAALSPHYGSEAIALQLPFPPSASQVQTPCLHRQQEVALQVELKACVYVVLMEPPGKQQ